MEELLKEHGIRPTANRLLVLKALCEAEGPQTMTELEDRIVSIDKSNIFRALMTFREHHLVHAIDTCDEGTKYEVCHSHGDHDEKSDEHVHFHCSVCHRTFCFEEIAIPVAAFPAGFEITDINYVATGICPECAKKRR